jgi:hypothetical protein
MDLSSKIIYQTSLDKASEMHFHTLIYCYILMLLTRSNVMSEDLLRSFLDFLLQHRRLMNLHVPCTTAALRSMDLPRQVGAVIATSNGESPSTGSNEVQYPEEDQYGNHQVSESEKDNRDVIVGYDSPVRMAHEL